MVLKAKAARNLSLQTMSFTMNDIGMVTCCATAEGYVSNLESNPTCAGSEAPPPAPVTAPVVFNFTTSTPTVSAATSFTNFGETSMESTCCNAPEGEGCDAASAFPVAQSNPSPGSMSVNGIGMVVCCGSGDGQVNNMSNNPACAGSDIPSPPAPIPAPAPEPAEPSTPTVIDNTESTCCNALEGNACANPYPVQTMSFTMNDIGMVTCCATADGYVSNLESNPTCAGSETPAPATGSTPSPTPSAGFTSSTSAAIGASVAFLVMIFV